ncbi:MAG: AAA family ATPase [Oscillospiraceae bacterium]|nr:AAA family ATPase [Oscillospiraceae bacterium]
MTDNLQLDVISSILTFHADLLERGELQNLDEGLFTNDIFREIFVGLKKAGFIPAVFHANCEDSEISEFVKKIENNGVYNNSFKDVVKVLKGQRVGGELICAADIVPKKIEWIMENFIPLGMLSSFQGLPDAGKSFLTGAITAAVTNSDGKLPTPDGLMSDCVHGGDIIFNSDDSPAYTTVPRLQKMGVDLKRVHFENPDSEPLTFADERLPLLLERIKPVLVIFDPIQNFIGAGVDFHRVNEIHPVMRKLEVLSAKANIVPGIPPADLFDLDPDTGFSWAGVSHDVTAKDLIREQYSRSSERGRPADKSDYAESVIQEVLADNGGEMLSEELRSVVCGGEGISERTYNRVKKAIGVVSFQKGRQWFVRLPDCHNC